MNREKSTALKRSKKHFSMALFINELNRLCVKCGEMKNCPHRQFQRNRKAEESEEMLGKYFSKYTLYTKSVLGCKLIICCIFFLL